MVLILFVLMCFLAGSETQLGVGYFKSPDLPVENENIVPVSEKITNVSKLSKQNTRTTTAVTFMWSENITDLGTWVDWKYCDEGYYIYGVEHCSGCHTVDYSGDYTNPIKSDCCGISKLSFLCRKIDRQTLKHILVMGDRCLTAYNMGKLGNAVCLNGPAVGIQLDIMPLMGAQDDESVINFRLFCKLQPNEIRLSANTTNLYTYWSAPLKCPKQTAICGVRTRSFRTRGGKRKEILYKRTDWYIEDDDHGITNVAIACCPILHPASNCIPNVFWKSIRKCTMGRCQFSMQTGIKYNDIVNLTISKAYEGLGFTFGWALINLQSNTRLTFDDSFDVEETFKDVPISVMTIWVWEKQCNGDVQQMHIRCHNYDILTTKYRCE